MGDNQVSAPLRSKRSRCGGEMAATLAVRRWHTVMPPGPASMGSRRLARWDQE